MNTLFDQTINGSLNIIIYYSFKTDWAAVKAKTEELAVGVFANCGQIRAIAKEDNAEVAKAINPKLDDAIVIAKDILNNAKESIANKSLTETEAKVYINSLKKNLIRTKGSLQDDLAKLSPAASEKITGLCDATFALVEEKASEVMNLLSPQ